jgi:hypothetical protein
MAGRNMKSGPSALTLFLLLIFAALRCDEEKDPEHVFMSFLIPIRIAPQTDQFEIQDTIWVDGTFPDTLQEFYSGNYYKLPAFDFKSKLCIVELVDKSRYVSDQAGAMEQFGIVNRIGSVNQVSSICGSIDFVYKDESYHYKIGLVTDNPGVFTINFPWPIDLHGLPEEQIFLTPVIDLGVTADGRPRIPVYAAFYFVVNDGSTNFDLFKENCRAASLENPAPINLFYEQKGSFTFSVIESLGLLALNGNSQSSQVVQLFGSYGW